jgi:DNA-binding transcriptional LysR family regulator
MSRPDPFDGLSVFLAIARHGSFRKAAAALGVTPGAVSQALKSLEGRLATPLVHRTTRSVALTEAGERLLAGAGPAADTIAATLDDLVQSGGRPAGTLRLLVQRIALPHVIERVLPDFRRAFPDVGVEVSTEGAQSDFVALGHDAAIAIGEFIDRDLITLRVSPPFDWMVLGAPAYFRARGRPEVPEDLAHHDCINFRRSAGGELYRWEFERDGQALSVEPPGSLVIGDGALARRLAVQGMGLIYSFSLAAARELEEGSLVPVLEAFAPARDSLFLCFPRASRHQPKLRAFVDACRRLGLRATPPAAPPGAPGQKTVPADGDPVI